MAGAERPSGSIGKPMISEGRSTGVDGVFEGCSNGRRQPFEILLVQIECRAFRPNAGAEQGLVGVDVPNPRENLLIEKNRLDRPPARLQTLPKGFAIDQGGIGSQIPQNPLVAVLGAFEEVNPTEASGIDELHPEC